MRKLIFSILSAVAFLTALPGCHYVSYYYVSNTSGAPGSIRMKYTDGDRQHSAGGEKVRYKDSLIKKITPETFNSLNQQLTARVISSKEAEVILPAAGTILIGTGYTGMPEGIDSLYITTAEQTTPYSWRKFVKASKRSGGFFSSRFTLYNLK